MYAVAAVLAAALLFGGGIALGSSRGLVTAPNCGRRKRAPQAFELQSELERMLKQRTGVSLILMV